MTTYTIPAKQSNTGSIHDIADTSDRVIKFGKDCIYAVVLSSYYGGKGYTTHKTEEAAIKKCRSLSQNNWSHAIIDITGNSYTVNGDRLYLV